MKVAVVAPHDLSGHGGVETHILQINRAIGELGIEADVFGKGTGPGFSDISEYRPDEYDILHTHGSAFSSRLLRVTMRKPPRQRHVHTLHGVSIDYLLACRAWLNWRCYTATMVEGFFSRRADHVIAVSQRIARRAHQCFFVHDEKITVITNGYNVFRVDEGMRQDVRQRYRIDTGDIVLLFVGRGNDPVKGSDTITAAMNALLPSSVKIKLLAVPGDGFADADWLIRSGPIPHEQMADIYAAADIFVNASRNEGMPLTLIEAMAAGLPVIASPVGGVTEIITDHQNGILLAPNRSDLAERISQLVDNTQLRKSLAHNAPAAVAQLTWGHLAQQTVDVYRRLLS